MPKQLPAQSTRGQNRTGKWLRLCFIILVLGFVLPIAQAALVRWVRPPVTPLMLLRKAGARFTGAKAAPIRYEWRSLNTIPPDFLFSVLLAEDQRFFLHHGFDWREIRAAQRDAERTGKPVRGASTISMQCARSLFLWQGRSWIRKGLEVYYTFWLETFVPKRRILELYCNVSELGNGVYGIQAASRAYYGIDANRLSQAQCIRLAALLPAPLTWDPKKPSPRYAARIENIEQQQRTSRIPSIEQLGLKRR
jgi:monofunctional biosynthetic peptidoglycan transglycosylase